MIARLRSAGGPHTPAPGRVALRREPSLTRTEGSISEKTLWIRVEDDTSRGALSFKGRVDGLVSLCRQSLSLASKATNTFTSSGLSGYCFDTSASDNESASSIHCSN